MPNDVIRACWTERGGRRSPMVLSLAEARQVLADELPKLPKKYQEQGGYIYVGECMAASCEMRPNGKIRCEWDPDFKGGVEQRVSSG